MRKTKVKTYTATIYVGRKLHGGTVQPLSWGRKICQAYVDAVGLCVTFASTDFLYTNGKEPGFVVGLINYPRFPSSPNIIRGHALELAAQLLKTYTQYKVTVVFPDSTIMLSNKEI
jgi:hypothetical protein